MRTRGLRAGVVRSPPIGVMTAARPSCVAKGAAPGAEPRRQHGDQRYAGSVVSDDRWSGRVNVPGRHGDVPGRSGDTFAARLNPCGSQLVYSTYLGGSADDVGSGVVLDRAGNAYYAGFTVSPEFPATPGALKTSLEPGTTLIGFVTTLDSAGRMKWSTYLGGNGRDSAWGIGVNSSPHVYVSGARIGGFPVTAEAPSQEPSVAARPVRREARPLGLLAGMGDVPGRQCLRGVFPDAARRPRGHADVVGPTASTTSRRPRTRSNPPTPAAGPRHRPARPQRAPAVLLVPRRQRRRRQRGRGSRARPAGQPLRRRGDQLDRLPGHSRRDPPTYGGGEIDGLLAKVTLTRSSRMDAP